MRVLEHAEANDQCTAINCDCCWAKVVASKVPVPMGVCVCVRHLLRVFRRIEAIVTLGSAKETLAKIHFVSLADALFCRIYAFFFVL